MTSPPARLRAFEFWHPRIFEAPYYAFLMLQCLKHRLPIRFLAKANYALDHGELGLGSKFSTQMAFDQRFFLPTELLQPADPTRQTKAQTFIQQHGLPAILKPDMGAVGKGVIKIDDVDTLDRLVTQLRIPTLLQQFSHATFEYGVFYVRHKQSGRITGINQKHFPSVVGNGLDDIDTLARQHPRYTPHWNLFLRYIDTSRIPADKECVRLSFVGSHTMGCKFTNDTDLVTPDLTAAIDQICASQPGFNFGRFDVKAHSPEAFAAGEFVVIEVNGVASLPTHMFDPDHTLRKAYGIFFAHGRALAEAAAEHRDKPMQLMTYRALWARAKANHRLLNSVHSDALTSYP